MRVQSIFNPFYARLYKEFRDEHFTFLRKAFEQFIVTEWKGSFKRSGKWYQSISKDEIEWFSADEAIEVARTSHPEKLVRAGEVEGRFIKVTDRRSECWINKKSLLEWCQKQHEYLPRLEAARILGVSYKVVMSMAKAGIIRPTVSPRDCRHHFLRSDVNALSQLLSRFCGSIVENWDNSELITLNDAIQTILSGAEPLSSVFRAIEEGQIAPVARSANHPGIAGYLFNRNDLRMHRYTITTGSKLEPVVNATDASRILSISKAHLNGLEMAGILQPLTGIRTCTAHEKCFSLSDVRAVQQQYMLTSEIADRLGISRRCLIDHLRAWGMLHFAVPDSPHGYRWKFINRTIANSLNVQKSGPGVVLSIDRAA